MPMPHARVHFPQIANKCQQRQTWRKKCQVAWTTTHPTVSTTWDAIRLRFCGERDKLTEFCHRKVFLLINYNSFFKRFPSFSVSLSRTVCLLILCGRCVLSILFMKNNKSFPRVASRKMWKVIFFSRWAAMCSAFFFFVARKRRLGSSPFFFFFVIFVEHSVPSNVRCVRFVFLRG